MTYGTLELIYIEQRANQAMYAFLAVLNLSPLHPHVQTQWFPKESLPGFHLTLP